MLKYYLFTDTNTYRYIVETVIFNSINIVLTSYYCNILLAIYYYYYIYHHYIFMLHLLSYYQIASRFLAHTET